ncbi:MAG: Nif3-like dinuclear metal center hexameric protein [Bacillota bacterium]
MITLNELVTFIDQQFKTRELSSYKTESGVTYDSGQSISNIGYATNITVDVVEKAKQQNVDLIITHHDAWDFIYGLKEAVMEKLKAYHISHYFTHLPLDDASFGTNSSLIKKLGLKEVSRHCHFDGYSCGALGTFDTPVAFKALVETFETLTEEPALTWNFGNKFVKTVYVVCGAGGETNLMKEALDLGADVYLTGEKVLYTMQYANLHNMNLIIGSHTFTELFGVESLMNIISNQFKSIEVKLIKEDHIETLPFRND